MITAWLCRFFALLAAVGFCLAVAWHVAALGGPDLSWPRDPYQLVYGSLFVWGPALVILSPFRDMFAMGDLSRYEEVVRGAPKPLVAIAIIASIYALVAFFSFSRQRADVSLSAFAMAVYALGFVIHWAAARRAAARLDSDPSKGAA